jgi:hypothetical protein
MFSFQKYNYIYQFKKKKHIGHSIKMVFFFFFFLLYYITPVNNLTLGARKPQRFTNIYNEQYN